MRSTQFARPFSNWASHMPSCAERTGSPLQTLGWSSMNRVVDLKWLSWNSWNLMPGHVMCSDRVLPCLLNLLRTDFDVCIYIYSYNYIYTHTEACGRSSYPRTRSYPSYPSCIFSYQFCTSAFSIAEATLEDTVSTPRLRSEEKQHRVNTS